MKYSFLMPYYIRSEQLRATLESFDRLYSSRSDFEVVIGEDIKNVNNEEEHVKLLELIREFGNTFKIRHIETDFKDCYNPAPIFSACAKGAIGDFFIVTSPEIMHKNDVLKGFDEELFKNENSYVIPSCACVRDISFVDNKLNFTHVKWYQHSKHRRSLLHWCNVISRENYFSIGGFDDNFSKGIACEDNDFLERIRDDKQIELVIRDDLEVLHIEHTKPRLNMKEYKKLHQINMDYCDKKRMDRLLGKKNFHNKELNKKNPRSERGKTGKVFVEPINVVRKPTFISRVMSIGNNFKSLNRIEENSKCMWTVTYTKGQINTITKPHNRPLDAVIEVLDKLNINY